MSDPLSDTEGVKEHARSLITTKGHEPITFFTIFRLWDDEGLERAIEYARDKERIAARNWRQGPDLTEELSDLRGALDRLEQKIKE